MSDVAGAVPKPPKPLKGKAYGSIGHLPNSRIGPADHHIHPGQAVICCEKPRKGDRVIVTEKLDGACMAVANIDNDLVALSRAGYRATDALYPHLKMFADYVELRRFTFLSLLEPGERVVGEWLAMAHGTLYDRDHPGFAPFIAFDIFRDGKRVLFEEFCHRVDAARLARVKAIHNFASAMCVAGALTALGERGFYGATDQVEGAVWRIEREGRVDFLAKYVRPEKVDGKYLPNISEAEPIWFWRPQAHVPDHQS